MSRCRGSGKFPPSRRLRRRAEFQAAQQRGRRWTSAHFVVLSQPRRQDQSRLGITVSRRVGPAVVRNRVKRLIREFYRQRPESGPGRDVVVIARPGAGQLGYREVAEELEPLLSRAAGTTQSPP